MADRFDVKVMGVNLGTASGWDAEFPKIVFYDFIPDEGISIGIGDLQIDYGEGTYGIIDSDGSVNSTGFIKGFL